MLRIIIRDDDYCHAIHVGGKPLHGYTTFDVELPDVEAHLTAEALNREHSVIGVEIIPPATLDTETPRP